MRKRKVVDVARLSLEEMTNIRGGEESDGGSDAGGAGGTVDSGLRVVDNPGAPKIESLPGIIREKLEKLQVPEDRGDGLTVSDEFTGTSESGTPGDAKTSNEAGEGDSGNEVQSPGEPQGNMFDNLRKIAGIETKNTESGGENEGSPVDVDKLPLEQQVAFFKGKLADSGRGAAELKTRLEEMENRMGQILGSVKQQSQQPQQPYYNQLQNQQQQYYQDPGLQVPGAGQQGSAGYSQYQQPESQYGSQSGASSYDEFGNPIQGNKQIEGLMRTNEELRRDMQVLASVVAGTQQNHVATNLRQQWGNMSKDNPVLSRDSARDMVLSSIAMRGMPMEKAVEELLDVVTLGGDNQAYLNYIDSNKELKSNVLEWAIGEIEKMAAENGDSGSSSKTVAPTESVGKRSSGVFVPNKGKVTAGNFQEKKKKLEDVIRRKLGGLKK
jgi:hypothetical protein